MQKKIFLILSFLIPFTLYFLTISTSLGFADAAEFAYAAEVWGIPHPPGFPSYVFFSWIWLNLFGWMDHITALSLFSVMSMAGACVLLDITLRNLFAKINIDFAGKAFKKSPEIPSREGLGVGCKHARFFESQQTLESMAALITTMVFAFGMTVWQWANAVEVYAFHVFCASLTLFGVYRYHFQRDIISIIVAGTGLGLGVANHHLTIVMAIPFILLFLGGKITEPGLKLKVFLKNFDWKGFAILALASLFTAGVFYGLMVYRAGKEYTFEFGNPDNLSRLIYHLTGGLWLEHSVESKVNISERFAYFIDLVYRQYFIFLIPLILGLIWLARNRYYKILLFSFGYFLLVFLYQLRIEQIADTDAYLLIPFLFLAIPLGVGITELLKKPVAIYILPAVVVFHMVFNYSESDRSDYNVSQAMMEDFHASAPENSVVLLSQWTLRIQYQYYRLAKNFRTDLIVLRSDLKGSNYQNMIEEYPGLYEKVKNEYHAYLKTIEAIDPDYVYSDYYTIANRQQDSTYKAMLKKVFEIASGENRQVMMDRQTVKFFLDIKLISQNQVHPHGLFFSTQPIKSNYVLTADAKWMKQDILSHDPSASNIIRDYYELINQCTGYYQFIKDKQRYEISRNQQPVINKIKRTHQKNVPFAWGE